MPRLHTGWTPVSNLQDNVNISALLARRPETLKAQEISALQVGMIAGAAVLSEGQIYDEVAGLLRHDPHTANDLLLSMGDGFDDYEPAWSNIRVHLLAAACARMQELDALRVGASGPDDRAREAAFRARPGRFLPGATPSTIRRLREDRFGLVTYEDQTWAWTYAAVGMARSDLSEFVAYVDDEMRLMPLAGGILVGPPEVAGEVVLPEGYRFVAVEF